MGRFKNLFEFFYPSKEKLFFFLLVAIASNFPYVGTYHTEYGYANCLQTDVSRNCQGETFIRQLHFNPIFWFPYTQVSGNTLVPDPQTSLKEDRIPLLQLQDNLLTLAFFLTVAYWYIAASFMTSPLPFGKDASKGD